MVFVSVRYVRREANFFAHNIAKLDIEGDDDVLWWGEVPSLCINPDFI